MLHIGNNIKLIRLKAGLTQPEFGQLLGITKAMVINYEKNISEPNELTIERLSNFSGVAEDDLRNRKIKESDIKFTNIYKSQKEFSKIDQEPISFHERLSAHKNNQDKKKIPLFDAPAVAGVDNADMTAVTAPSGTIDVGDLLSDSQCALRVYGNSMIPNYPPGCVVGLRTCSSDFIEPGEVYVLETEDRRVLKRLFYKNDDPASDYILLYSDNVMRFEGGPRANMFAYPPALILKSDIKRLYQVTGVIKRNANSIILNKNT